MQTYCVGCRKNTNNINLKMVKTKDGRLQLKSQCPICGNKKIRFLKEQEAKGILSKIPELNILF